ncbi:MAG: GerMN domain-containing protein [Firmicutes bacterium]|mgnify:CR=1 FL=1|jgi:spore germination protein GerM|nr:GerMN domain-containing protein [Bacillota bacterium]NLL89048.1 GerMN domain-containing protein [Bacillota bacterium]HKM17036.1 GerMN domain-containing protein [Limnochordia bacterium]
MTRHKQWIAVTLLIASAVFALRLSLVQPALPTVSDQLWAVYFGSGTDSYLVPELRFGMPTINSRLQALVTGPRLKGLKPVFPPGTRVISYQIEGNLILVNFNKALMENHPGGSASELVTVYGLVNTLTEDPSLDYVQILIEGRRVDTIAGHVDVSLPLRRDESSIGAR